MEAPQVENVWYHIVLGSPGLRQFIVMGNSLSAIYHIYVAIICIVWRFPTAKFNKM